MASNLFADIVKTVSTSTSSDKPKAQLWLNVGLKVGNNFYSLPVNIALDTMQPLSVKSSNDEFAKTQAIRNKILEKLLELGKEVKPGERKDIPDGQLQLQLQRVAEAKEVDTSEVEVNFHF